MKKMVAFFLIFVLSFSCTCILTSCNKDKENIEKNNEEVINIKVGDTYELSVNDKTLYASSNTDVADVNDEGIITAYSEGTANINAITVGDTKKYVVNAVFDDGAERDAFGDFNDIDYQQSYIGKGYNVITSNYMDSDNVLMEYPIFDTTKLSNAKLSVDKRIRYSYTEFSGDTMEDFSSDYTNKLTANAKASYKKYFSASVDTDFSEMAKNKTVSKMRYLKYSTVVQKLKLTLCENSKNYSNFLDEDFSNDLMEMSPDELFARYGTHVIISAIYGGRLDYNYFLSSTDQNVKTETLKNISASISTSFAGFSADGNVTINDNYKTEATNNNVEVQMRTTAHGGALFDLRNEASINKNYTAWLSSISNANPETIDLISLATCNSLYGIWNLVPTNTTEGVKRRDELINYFNAQLGDTYNELIDKYTIKKDRKPSYTIKNGLTQVTLGEYPQREASTGVSSMLKNNKGNKLNKTFDGCNVYELDGKRYVEYIYPQGSDGYSASNNYGYSSGNTYYFLVEPIVWIKASNFGGDLYFSSTVLDSKQYFSNINDKNINYTRGFEKAWGNCYDEKNDFNFRTNSWEHSTLRNFLNGEFYNFAFEGCDKYLSFMTTPSTSYQVVDIRPERTIYSVRDSVTLPGYKMHGLPLPTNQTDFAKARIQNTALTAMDSYFISGTVNGIYGFTGNYFPDYSYATDKNSSEAVNKTCYKFRFIPKNSVSLVVQEGSVLEFYGVVPMICVK